MDAHPIVPHLPGRKVGLHHLLALRLRHPGIDASGGTGQRSTEPVPGLPGLIRIDGDDFIFDPGRIGQPFQRRPLCLRPKKQF